MLAGGATASSKNEDHAPAVRRSGRGLGSVTNLILKRGASRLSGEWSEDDYDALCEGAGVGRMMKAAAAPGGHSVEVDHAV